MESHMFKMLARNVCYEDTMTLCLQLTVDPLSVR